MKVRTNSLFKLICLSFISLLLSNISFAHEIALCPNYNIENQLPNFESPPEKSFKHFANKALSFLFNPHHGVIDDVFNEKEHVHVTAKFDYDWVLHKNLEDETIHAYIYNADMDSWHYLGSQTTSKDGKVDIAVGHLHAGSYLIRMVVEGDSSTVDGFVSVIKFGQEAIVFDIDGTLTKSDLEIVKDYLKIKSAEPYPYAKELIDAYKNKHFLLVFLTARPYWMNEVTRDWINNILQAPSWQLRTKNKFFGNEALPDPTHTTEYKVNYLRQLIDKGVLIKRVYGNAKTDIDAYEKAGIEKNNTYIIGENAGQKRTQPILNDYYDHLQQIVANTDDAQCITE